MLQSFRTRLGLCDRSLRAFAFLSALWVLACDEQNHANDADVSQSNHGDENEAFVCVPSEYLWRLGLDLLDFSPLTEILHLPQNVSLRRRLPIKISHRSRLPASDSIAHFLSLTPTPASLKASPRILQNFCQSDPTLLSCSLIERPIRVRKSTGVARPSGV